VTGGPLEGDVSWRKPILFGEAFGLTCVSIAWFMTFLPRRPLLGWPLAFALGIANIYEVFWVSMQQWRGVPSHFNASTPFDAALFAAAGVMIFFTAAVTLTVTVWSFLSLRASPSLAWAIRCGLLLLLAGQMFGILIINHGSSTFGIAGNLKVAHALALHAAQLLPLLAWLLSHGAGVESRRLALTLAGIAGYTLLVAISAQQAFGGLAPLDLGPGRGSLLAFGAVLLIGSFVAGVLLLRSQPAS
jgi:hypothetical protein